MNSTIVGLVAAIAVLSGGLGLSLTDVFDDQKPMITNAATGLLMGHLEVEARNVDGDIFAYRQSDNEVVDGGEHCILKLLFATTGGGGDGDHGASGDTDFGRGQYATSGDGTGSECTGILTGAWDVIAVGTGAVARTAAEADVYSGLLTELEADGLARAFATTKTWENGTAGTTDTNIIMKKTFTATASHNVDESGLFNSTAVATGGMLAHQTFPEVALTSGDSITITWTFIVDN